MGYSFWLAARFLLAYTMAFVHQSRSTGWNKKWLNGSTMRDQSDDPLLHEWTLSQSYISLHTGQSWTKASTSKIYWWWSTFYLHLYSAIWVRPTQIRKEETWYQFMSYSFRYDAVRPDLTQYLKKIIILSITLNIFCLKKKLLKP